MRVAQLRIQALRCLDDVSLSLSPGINAFVGANGAGKTSLLEAVFLLSHGRSFRSGAKEALLKRGASGLTVFADVVCVNELPVKLGLGREAGRWQARVDFRATTVTELLGHCAVVSFDPGAHALIASGAEERRRFLDWGVFHVEHEFLEGWRRYQRALKQRNSLLRRRETEESLFHPWERELVDSAELIDAWRRRYLDALRPLLARQAAELLPELGQVSLRYRSGWPEASSLDEVLRSQREKDLARGHTSSGAHRCDWMVAFENAPLREHLSRGQEKLAALACLLAQAELYAAQAGEWPIVCIDDLASELDVAHQTSLVRQLRVAGAQVLATGTELPASLDTSAQVFHVEQGQVKPLL